MDRKTPCLVVKTSRLVLALILAALLPARALSISLVYQDPADPFFNSQARAALDRAAADVSTAITTTLAALNQRTFTGTSGTTAVSAAWTLSYYDPNTGASTVVDTFDFAPDEFRIYVGRRALPSGVGGIGGVGGYGLGLTPTGDPSGLTPAVADLETISNSATTRGGPVRATATGTLPYGEASTPFTLQMGYAIGSLSLTTDANWHFDHLTLPAANQMDFYSVALHEILHTVGFGTGDTWHALAAGPDWLGSHVASLLGTGTDVLSENSDHIREGLTGIPLIDGQWATGLTQEALMGPTITLGTRKHLTDLDLAFLQDTGWQTNPVPEPTTFALIILTALALHLKPHRRSRA